MKKLFKLAMAGALVFGVIKLMETKREFEHGTEEELRGKVESKFGDKVPADKLEKVQDKVVEFARAKGTLVEPSDVVGNGNGTAADAPSD